MKTQMSRHVGKDNSASVPISGKSTPGPWAFEYGQIVAVLPHGLRVPVVTLLPPGPNARLIARAPEMLTLIRLLAGITPDECRIAQAEARALLREIEGETP